MTYRVKGWSKFQHFKDRKPPWIKLHRELLDDRGFNELSPMACKVLVMVWLIASESMEGHVTSDISTLAFRLRLQEKAVKSAIDELYSAGFILDSDAPAESAQVSNAKSIAAKNGFGSRHISDNTKRSVWERDGGKCCFCGSVSDIEYDHIHPVSKGGNSELENVQLLCRPCNRKKRTKTTEQLATPAQPWLDIRTTETETEAEAEAEKPAAQAPFSLPDWINKTHWDAWHSGAKRKKATAAQKQMTVDKLAGWRAQGLDYAGALENAAVGGWQGLFLPDQGKPVNNVQTLTVPAKPGRDPELERLDRESRQAKGPSLAILEQMARIRQGAKA